jgi:hypothetical protein
VGYAVPAGSWEVRVAFNFVSGRTVAFNFVSGRTVFGVLFDISHKRRFWSSFLPSSGDWLPLLLTDFDCLFLF